jgi:hypothetical protein
MSDIGLNWGVTGWAVIVLIVGWPGLLAGAVAGLLLWRRHRIAGALIGAALGLMACLAAVYFWKMSDWG